jgi:hypothetical protein
MLENIISLALFVGVVYGGYRFLKWYDNRNREE